MILEARRLDVGYRHKAVLRGVDVALAAGEVLALLGPNGGGKTTLLKTLLGLVPPLAGEIRLADLSLNALTPAGRARLRAYVPQVHAGTFAFTVEDIVMMGRSARSSLFAAPSARDREAVAEAIERLGIGALAQRPYTEISGGERQLALLARALAQEPRLLVLDEPTASLDFGNQGKVMRQIRRLAGEGLGVIFSTHDPNQALAHAGSVMLIGRGACLGSGPAAELLTAERLSALYGAEVSVLADGAARAFLPA